jgi:lipid II:glycine glycyltransferase (peptidoglycan interpeptide bridge formation enzyme)
MVPETTPPETAPWNELIRSLPQAHLLQTSQWADLKARYGWTPSYLIWEESQDGWQMRVYQDADIQAGKPVAAGLILEREAFPGLRVLYLPKGPLMADWSNQALSEKVLDDLAGYARGRGALQIKIDPDLELGHGVPGEDGFQAYGVGEVTQDLLRRKGWEFSREQIQFRNTVLVDLQENEEQILARMKSKTRYNIRLAGRKGIQIRLGEVSDLPSLYRMYADTSRRAGFTIRGESYYLTLWRSFMEDGTGRGQDPQAQPIVAEYEGKLVSGAVIFKFGERSWYLHGMSLPEHSEKMAPHLIQWEAMRWAKNQGCVVYDMWGAPDQFDESDSLWGVYRFKRGFGGEVSLTLGAWDFPARPIYYAAYSRWLPKVLQIMRWFGNWRTDRVARSIE